MQIPDDCSDELKAELECLLAAKRNFFFLIIGRLMKGECSYLSNDLYGYPYDYKLYAKDSLEPQVQILNRLIEKVEQTFEALIIAEY